jgi:Domain of unknown function (DUF5010)
MRHVLGVVCGVLILATGEPGWRSDAQPMRNAGKYGAMFSWWYDRLLPQTIHSPTVQWDARRQLWWTTVVRQARDAGLGWIAAASWGAGTTADPAQLRPLIAAIEANGGGLKVALFDDTTSEVLRKNEARGHGWTLDVPFDLADLEGRGEGGFQYFYDQQWKRYFATVPDQYRLKLHGRPVVFMWHSHSGGLLRYANAEQFHTLLRRLREATRRDFGVDPFVIPEERWMALDPSADPDAIYAWFDAPRTPATVRTFKGIRIANVVPGYDCSLCDPPGPTIDRQDGDLYRLGLQAVAPDADLVLIEGLVNIDENAHIVETFRWGRLYLDITRWFAINVP